MFFTFSLHFNIGYATINLKITAVRQTGVTMNKNKLNRLDEMMQSQVDSGMIPGGHLRIIKDGERVYDKCFGMADVARSLKISDNTILL